MKQARIHSHIHTTWGVNNIYISYRIKFMRVIARHTHFFSPFHAAMFVAEGNVGKFGTFFVSGVVSGRGKGS